MTGSWSSGTSSSCSTTARRTDRSRRFRPRTSTPAPASSGMAVLLQGVDSVFDTDAFRPLIAVAERASGRPYGVVPRDDRALRVLADHGRAMTFLAADGVRPGNEGRDYILRRIVRRAVSEATHLGLEPGFVADLSQPVVEAWGEVYPELRERAAEVRDVLGRRGRAVRAHAHPGPAPPGRGHRPVEREWPGEQRRRLPAARHLRLPPGPDARSGRRRGAGGGRGGLRAAIEEQRDPLAGRARGERRRRGRGRARRGPGPGVRRHGVRRLGRHDPRHPRPGGPDGWGTARRC